MNKLKEILKEHKYIMWGYSQEDWDNLVSMLEESDDFNIKILTNGYLILKDNTKIHKLIKGRRCHGVKHLDKRPSLIIVPKDTKPTEQELDYLGPINRHWITYDL